MPGFHTTGPNRALVISSGRKAPKVVVGGRAFVVPIIQRVQVLSLEVMTLTPSTAKVYTKEGVAVTVDGVAQVKVASEEGAILRAAQQFLGKRPEEVANIALQTIEGNQRAILGTMTVEEIYQDREGFATNVLKVAGGDMANMGLEVVSYTIRDIQDDQGYLDALGIPRTAEVKRDAAIAQAEADRDATIRQAQADRDSGIQEAQADQERQAARFAADTAIAESERDFQLQKASFDQQTFARQAEAELAHPLQEAKTRQEIRQEEMQVQVVERQKQIQVQEQEVARREQELEATVRRPAQAERHRLETIAEGNRARVVAEAQAEAEAIRVRGEAEADAIKARGLAEAEAMQRKAEAWKQYGQAALIEQLFQSLPEVARAVAEPLSKTERIVMISGGGDSAGVGASRVTKDVTNIIAQLPAVVEALTGIDVLATLKNLPGVRTVDGEVSSQAESVETPKVEAGDPAATV